MRRPAAGGGQAAVVALLLLCCLQQLLPGRCDEQAAAAPQGAKGALATPDYSLYLRKTDFFARVREVVSKHPDVMKYETRHAKDEDYKADIMVVTVEPSGLSPTHKSKARLLLDFGEHGREFITSEVGLLLLQVLGDPQQLSQLVGGGRRAARLQAILQHCVFKILPMENVAGRDLVEGGNLCERKNGRGVDPNRNWDIDWGVKEKDYDPKEEYPGKAALSEPEVQVLLSLAKELKPHVWLNVHSGMYALFTPYDHKGHVPNTTDARAALRMMKRIQDLVCPQCKVGSGGHTVGYLAHGTATDYMFEVLKIPMSFTWEIYGDEDASYDDCFRMFNPLGKEHFDQVASLWVKALLQLVELLPTHPATWPYFKKLGLERWEAVAPKGNATLPAAQDTAAAPAAAAVQPAPVAAAKPAEQAEPVALLPSTPKEEPQPQPAAAAQPAPAQAQPAALSQQQQQQPAVQPEPQQQQQQPGDKQQQAEPEKLQQPAGVQPGDSDSSSSSSSGMDVSIEEHLGSGSSRGHDRTLVLINRFLPWALGVAGFVVVLYLVTREKGVGYSRLPIRQPPPSSRAPARR